MNLLISTSLITAFLAGSAALLAPCCVGVLLPSYLATVFKTKSKIFFMTFIYFLGLLVVFLPLGLGVAGLSQTFSQYHSLIFTIGGAFMLFMGLMLLAGRSFMLPFKPHPKLERYDVGSIFVLGVFSGIATTCCAPVLAGVLALAALPGSWLLGSTYAVAYVLGMVVPLFILAGFIDRVNVTQRFLSLRRTVSYRLFGTKIWVSLSNLAAGALYVAVGLFILAYARRSQESLGSLYQLNVNIALAKLSQAISGVTRLVPEAVWAVVVLLVVVWMAWTAYRQATQGQDDIKDNSEEK
jgi:cytochrome c-type biogenesis protein